MTTRNDLTDDNARSRSPVVANATMNRGRGLAGVNSYAREIRLNPLDVLAPLLRAGRHAAWLDLCCGRGRALIDAGRQLRDLGVAAQAALVGVDLVPMFDPVPPEIPVRLITAPLHEWTPRGTFDLITCVHGLHDVGDKLGLLARIPAWLGPDGRFVANLDPANIVMADATTGTARLGRTLRAAGFSLDRQRHLITRVAAGPSVPFPCRYLGADTAAGPNYTGQAAVTSHYVPDPA